MRQKHGQNFLTDNNIVHNIVKAASLTKEDEVLEIGPGKGALTKVIAPLVKHLTAVEIDKILADQLKYYFDFHKSDNVAIINEDFLQASPQALPVFTSPLKIISNLPYNVGTAIIQKILPLPNWTTCVFMLQKEVIERLAAKPGGKEYGYISVFTQYYADAQILFDVSPRCFSPEPKVMSSVIKLTNKNAAAPYEQFFSFIKHAFSQRRKTILNSLNSFTDLDKPSAEKILRAAGIDPMLRPDKLSIKDFEEIVTSLPL